MKKLNKCLLNVLSIFLVILFLLQIVPDRLYAAAGVLLANTFWGEDASETPEREPEAPWEEAGAEAGSAEDAVILGELVDKRTADTKYYRMSDGSYLALQYPQAVHYEAGGGWTEYDNTLREADGGQELETTASDVAVRLSKKTNGKKFVRVEKDGYQLSWYYEGAAKRTGEATAPADDGDRTTLEKFNTQMRYNGVFQDVDLQYILSGGTVKENLILHSAQTSRTYTAGYQSTGLTPVQRDARTILLNNKEGETVFVIAAPYMEDANRAVSEGVTLTLQEVRNGTFTLVMELDAVWLDDAARAYPVTVDPLLETSQAWNDPMNCESAYISSKYPNNCYGQGGAYYEGSLYAGRTNDRGMTRTLIKIPNLPALGIADKVVDARLAVFTTDCYPDLRVDLHRVISGWSKSTVCWNSNIRYDSTILDYQLIQTMNRYEAGKNRWQVFEITDLVRGWYNGEYPNYGVLLRSDTENGSDHAAAWFLSSDYPSTSAVRPVLQISYRNMSGYEDYWSYTNLGAGRSGVAGVNNYNGNLVYSQPVTGSAGGNLMPVDLSLVYNANAGAAPYTYLGEHLQTNYHIYVRYDSTTAANGFKYYLNDADGTRHWFYFEGASNTGKDEDGLGYTMEITPSVADGDNVNAKYTITDKDENKLYFNGPGNLIKITNAAGTSATVQYETSNNLRRIKTIKDGAGRTYTFGYNPAYWELCMSITDPAGRKTSFDYYQGTLCWITFPDGKSMELVYDYSRYVLTQIKAIDGTRVKISYDSTAQKRVTAIDSGAGENVLERYTFAYKQNATDVTDKQNRRYTYQFNDFGQTTGVVSNKDGTAQFYRLEPGNSTSRKANKLLSESKVLKSVTNYLVNPGFTRALGEGYGTYIENAAGTRTVAVDGSKRHFTKDSLKITKSQSNGGRVFALQDVTGISAGRYTLSGFIDTNGVTLPGDGAYLGIELRNSAGTLVYVASIEETRKTNGWERRSVTFDVPAGHSLRIIAGFGPSAYGSVWFDDLQLEKGTGESSFNLVENAGFLKGASRWESENGKSVLWNYGSVTGENCGKVPGTTEEQYKNIIQNLPISGKAGDVFSFGMWVAADSAPIKNGMKDDDAYQPRFDIILHYYDANTGLWKGFVGQDCNPDLKGQWQFVTKEAIIPSDYSRLAIQLVYNHNVNDAYMTGAFCYKEQYGQTYTYDGKGNVVSSVDLAKTQSEFAYYGNQMAKLLNPSGSRYLYTYDDKKQLTYALTSDGQQYGFTYDSKGNVTSAVVTARKPAVTLEAGKEYYIVNSYSGQAIDSGWRGQDQKISTYRYAPSASQQRWKLEKVSGTTDVYYLKSVYYSSNNYYMDVIDASAAQGTKLWAYAFNGSNAQKFKIQRKDGNTFGIFTGASNYEKALDGQLDTGDTIILSQDVKQAACNPSRLPEGMRWLFYPVESTESKELSTSAAYTSSGNFVSAATDQRGNTTRYNYTENSGLLNSVTDPLGRITNYTYDATLGRLTGVSSGGSTVSYSYEKDFLTEITANNTLRYKFLYDQYGRQTETRVGNGTTYRTLSGNTYNAAGLLSRQTYGNGTYLDYTYDNLDRLTGKQYNGSGTQKVEYAYGSNGSVSQETDYMAGTKTKYVYDLAGRVVSAREYAGTDLSQNDLKASVDYTYADKTNYLTGVSHFSELGTQRIGYRYGSQAQGQMPDQIYGVTWNGTEKQSYTYDGLGRLTNQQIKPSSTVALNSTYTYVNAAGNKTTTLVETVTNAAGTYTYSYDAAGNITSITDGTYLLRYEYDGLNQLIREDDERAGKTYVYEYANGNITKKKEYAYTTGTVSGTPLNTIEWKYWNEEWRDLLSLWNGQPLEYDAIGNLTAYGYSGHTRREFEWTGRRLDAMSICHVTYTTNIAYGYNGEGQRTRQTVTGENGRTVTTRYVYNGEILAGQISDDGRTILFYYDNNGEYFGFRYNDAEYYYLRNAQNDVIAIADSTGTVVVRYYYDAWGKLLRVTDGAGNAVTDESHVGVINPIRYRGYYYDSETGYYLTGSRYYDPTVGRFINADGQINTSQGILGCNMYAYCLNNPVNMVDHDGRKPGDLFDTMDEAAKDFANYINAQSISENLEYGSFMYSVKTTVKTYQTVTTTHRFLWWTWTSTSTKTIKTTKIQYSYVAPKKGKPAGVSIPVNWFGAKKKVAELHTHAAYDPKYDNDIFSPGDLNKWINYVATPLGTVRKYDPKNPSSERDKAIEIYNDIPWDSNHPSR